MEDLEMTREFWNGRSVFLTGHTGFKGGWLSLWLQRMGARVSGYALAPAHEHGIFTSARLADGMASTIADVRDARLLCSALATAAPDIVLHFAAQPLVRASYAIPAETYDVNVMGTVNFLEAVRATQSVQVAIIVTSDKCYENREWPWGYRETDHMGGKDPYSSSKGCAELVTAAYRHSFFAESGVALATVRAGNVIGGGDWAEDRLIPDMMRAWTRREPLRIRYPHAIRPWQHVLEPLRGYLMLAERLWNHGTDCAEGWNFGPREEDACPVDWLVRQGTRFWGDGVTWETDNSNHPHEAHYLKLDCSKARVHLGWYPMVDVAKALEWTIDWYRAQHEGKTDMRTFTQEQMDCYEQLMSGTNQQ
jgi:CDP-glucose 4,6-dehydratase